MIRSLLFAAAAAVVVVFAAIQFASSALFGTAASAGSIPAHLSQRAGERVFGVIARTTPLTFANQMLAMAALRDNRLDDAQRYASRMPVSAARSEIEARLALARGDRATAIAKFVEADDVDALTAESQRLAAAGDIASAFALEERIGKRLTTSGTHPDAVAESYWRSGMLAERLSELQKPSADRWMQTALRYYGDAHALAPFSEKYLLAAGTQAMRLHDEHLAKTYFQNTLTIDPASADAFAGLGILALDRGDRAAATAYFARAQGLDPNSKMLRELGQRLR